MPIDSTKLRFGPYRTPRVKIGGKLTCTIRGEVVVTSISDGRIPWPRGFAANRGTAMVLCGDLEKAVRNETAAAVRHWWGVGSDTVWKWRKALGAKVTPGDIALRSEYSSRPEHKAMIGGVGRKFARDPERRRKIAAARIGKARPPEVIQAMRQANLGRKLSAAHRKKLSAAHKKRRAISPAVSNAEEELLRKLPPEEFARRTGRPLVAVLAWRRKLGIK